MRDAHMAHEDHEADPWHVRAFDVRGDEVGSDCICHYEGETLPEIKETDQVEDADGDDEDVLEARVVVREAFEYAG